MGEVLAVVPAGLLWASVAWRLVRPSEESTGRTLTLALAALALTATLEVPRIEEAAGALTPQEPNLPYLVKHLLVVGVALAAWQILRDVNLSPSEARDGVGRRVALGLLVAAVLAALFLAAPVEEAAIGGFTPRYDDEPLIVAFWLIFLVWLSAALLHTMRLSWRTGSRARTTSTGTGILLIGAGAAVCLAYVVYKAAYTITRGSGIESGLLVGPYAEVTRALIVVAMLLLLAGCMWPTITGSRYGRRLATYRHLRRLRPLWRDVVEATPEVALPESLHGTRRTGSDLEVKLYRRVIEIRDGLLALRPYAPRGLRLSARAVLLQLGMPEDELEIAAEAVWLEFVLQRKRHGLTELGDDAGLPGGSDVPSEVRSLEALSRVRTRDHAVLEEAARRLDAQQAGPARSRR